MPISQRRLRCELLAVFIKTSGRNELSLDFAP
jgi:hypothetical protein